MQKNEKLSRNSNSRKFKEKLHKSFSKLIKRLKETHKKQFDNCVKIIEKVCKNIKQDEAFLEKIVNGQVLKCVQNFLKINAKTSKTY